MTTPTGPLPKLRSGELRDQVAQLLAANPGREYTTGQIADALGGRSSGAVGNALDRLVATGLVQLLPGPPRRYRITVAGAATIPTPAAVATPASTVGAADRPPRPGAVRRPGGSWYLPRRLAASTDVEVLRTLRRDTIPVLLYGPPGTGKTSLVEAAYPDLLTVPGHEDTTVEDFVGGYVPQPDGTFCFAYGPLVVAMREGRALFVDDATLISPKVLAVLYPAMDGRGAITIAAHRHEQVSAADGFYVAAAHNPRVHGAVLTEALASRFSVHIEVTTDFDLARTLGVPARTVAAAEALNTKMAAGDIDWAPQLRELIAFHRTAQALGLGAAVANLAAIAPDTDRAVVIAVLTETFGASVTSLTLGKQL